MGTPETETRNKSREELLTDKITFPSKSEMTKSITTNDDSNQNNNNNNNNNNNDRISKDPIDSNNNDANKAISCKGCLYYSSQFKNASRKPLCVGLTRSLSSLPRYIVGQSEVEASKEGRSLRDFRYACVGYSAYRNQKEKPSSEEQDQTELPVCVGIEILVDRRVNTAESPSTPSHIHNREDGNGLPQRRTPKPTHSTGEDFLSRFTRNANLVANGVVKNVRKVGNRIKQSVDDILYPYRRPPK